MNKGKKAIEKISFSNYSSSSSSSSDLDILRQIQSKTNNVLGKDRLDDDDGSS